jgi:hypothetical protein
LSDKLLSCVMLPTLRGPKVYRIMQIHAAAGLETAAPDFWEEQILGTGATHKPVPVAVLFGLSVNHPAEARAIYMCIIISPIYSFWVGRRSAGHQHH